MAKKGKKHGLAPTASSSNHVASPTTISAPPTTILATPVTISAPTVPLPSSATISAPPTTISAPSTIISVPPATILAPVVPPPPSTRISAPLTAISAPLSTIPALAVPLSSSATISVAPSTISAPAVPLLSPSTSISSLPAPASSPATRIAFREFIELADLESIKRFLSVAASSPEGENLRLLWARAFKEGLTVGHQLYGKTKEKLNEAHDSGYGEGFRDGSTSKIDLFQAGIDEGRRDEQGDWLIEGHGEHCGFQATVVREDSSVQTETIPPRSVATATVQVNTLKPPPRSTTMAAVQVDVLKPIPTTTPLTPCTVDAIMQTISPGMQDTSSQTSPHPGPTPNPTRITSPPTSLNWADDAMSLPISLPPISTPPISSLPILLSRPAPRDLSILRSSFSKPFSSLQRRNKRSQPHLSQPFRNRQSFNIPHQTSSRHHFPPPRFSTTSVKSARVYPSCIPQFSPSSALNWEGDPRLFELSRALNALGWVRP